MQLLYINFISILYKSASCDKKIMHSYEMTSLCKNDTIKCLNDITKLVQMNITFTVFLGNRVPYTSVIIANILIYYGSPKY